jgi:hypothetical protein
LKLSIPKGHGIDLRRDTRFIVSSIKNSSVLSKRKVDKVARTTVFEKEYSIKNKNLEKPFLRETED